MPLIEGFRVKNYKVLKDITLGKLWNTKDAPLTPLTVVIRKNGVGKSSIFDAFGFLSDCLKYGVEEACDLKIRGGLKKILSQDSKGPIEFSIYFRDSKNDSPITYELSIDIDENDRPFVLSERLRQSKKAQLNKGCLGSPYSFLILQNGKGEAWKGETAGKNELYPEKLKRA